MPVIKDYSASEKLDGDVRGQPRVNIDTSDSSARIAEGNAIMGLGREAQVLTDHWAQKQAEKTTFNDTLAAHGTKQSLSQYVDEAAQKIPENGEGFHDTHLPKLDEVAEAGFAKMSPQAAERARATWQAVERPAWGQKLAVMERETGAKFQADSIAKVQKDTLAQISANPDPAVADGLKAPVNALIDNAPYLTTVQKAAIKDSWEAGALATEAAARFKADPVAASKELGVPLGAGYTGTALDRTMALLRSKEGFKGTTYWDVNAHRLGYGSDTITDATGTIRSVKQGDVVTKDDAERDLRRRSQETLGGIQRAVGAEAFGALNANQQAALGSVAYNYGSLPQSVVKAVQTGDAETIATSIEGLKGHNDGVNASRRQDEANLARRRDNSEATKPSERYADLDGLARQKLVYGAEKEAVQAAAAAQHQARLDQSETKRLIGDDLASVKATGDGVPSLTMERVASALGVTAAQDWLAKRNYASQVHRATDGMDQMPIDQIHARVDQTATGLQVPGEGAAQRAALHQEVTSRAEEIITARLADPAQAVQTTGGVRAARERLQGDNSLQAREGYIDAVYAAQDALGVPSYSRSPITLGEAKQYAIKMRPLTKGQADVADQDRVIEGVVNEINDRYGKYAKDVLQRVMYHVTLKKEAGEVLANAMQRMVSTNAGPIVTADEAHRVNTERQSDDMRAASGNTVYDPMSGQSFSTDAAAGEPSAGLPFWKSARTPGDPNKPTFSKAIDALSADPEKLLPSFIQRYGRDRVPANLLKQYERGPTVGR
jgi:GH24 family phage-related lysozyme (muramidase)